MHSSPRFHRARWYSTVTPAGKEEFFHICTSKTVDPCLKLDAIKTQWPIFCRSRSEVEQVFYGSNVLQCALYDQYYDTNLIAFICFAIMKSGTIRRQVLDILLSQEFSPEVLSCPDIFLLLASCSIDIVTDREMQGILDHLVCLPGEYLLEKLIILKKLSRSLPFVGREQAITIRYIINDIVGKYSTGAIFVPDEQFTRFGVTVASIAKKISRVLPEHTCFRVQIWRPFLTMFGLQHDLTTICKVPFVLEDLDELPYKIKEGIKSGHWPK